MTEILHVFGPPNFLGERPPHFWNFLLLLSQIPIMWQSLVAIGRGTSEMWLPKKTSRVKQKPVCNYRSGRPNNCRASGSILTGLFSDDAPRGRGDKLGTIFYNDRPQKFVTAKKSPKIFRDFLTTFDFDREYLRNESTYQKSEKLLIIYNPSHIGPRKFGVLWSTNEKVIDSNKCTP